MDECYSPHDQRHVKKVHGSFIRRRRIAQFSAPRRCFKSATTRVNHLLDFELHDIDQLQDQVSVTSMGGMILHFQTNPWLTVNGINVTRVKKFTGSNGVAHQLKMLLVPKWIRIFETLERDFPYFSSSSRHTDFNQSWKGAALLPFFVRRKKFLRAFLTML
jgi:hypothetical protein